MLSLCEFALSTGPIIHFSILKLCGHFQLGFKVIEMEGSSETDDYKSVGVRGEWDIKNREEEIINIDWKNIEQTHKPFYMNGYEVKETEIIYLESFQDTGREMYIWLNQRPKRKKRGFIPMRNI